MHFCLLLNPSAVGKNLSTSVRQEQFGALRKSNHCGVVFLFIRICYTHKYIDKEKTIKIICTFNSPLFAWTEMS